jgi:hypothetical protein
MPYPFEKKTWHLKPVLHFLEEYCSLIFTKLIETSTAYWQGGVFVSNGKLLFKAIL